MTLVWKWVARKKIADHIKMRLFLLYNLLFFSAIGFLLWLAVRCFVLNTWEWAVCFTGYFGVAIGFLGGFLYICRQ